MIWIPLALYLVVAATVAITAGRHMGLTHRWRMYRGEVADFHRSLQEVDAVEPEPVEAMIAADVVTYAVIGLAWLPIFVVGGIIAAFGIACEVTSDL